MKRILFSFLTRSYESIYSSNVRKKKILQQKIKPYGISSLTTHCLSFLGDYSLARLRRKLRRASLVIPGGVPCNKKSNLSGFFAFPLILQKTGFLRIRRKAKTPRLRGLIFCCGEGGIRTPGTVARTPV